MDLYDVLLMRKFGGGGGKPSPSPSGGGEPKNVNFYDYEGTLLKSYTTDEWASVTELPENPTHEGLTAQGWNWSKTDIDDYISDYPEAIVNVGQIYITDDGKTRIYVHFEKGRTSPYLCIAVNGTVEIDWGDGSATDTLTGTSTSTLVSIQHVYQPGDYIIKLNPTNGSFSIKGTNSRLSDLLKKIATTGGGIYYNESFIYADAIKKIEFGLNVIIGDYALYNARNLAEITLPKSITSLGSAPFYGCISLKSIVFCDSITTIPASAFYNDTMLSKIILSSKITEIGSRAFSYCAKNIIISIPKSVVNIGALAFSETYDKSSYLIPNNEIVLGNAVFQNCYGVVEYHFLSITPPTIGSSMFSNIPSDCIIYVPMESVDAYKTATNWSSYASKIQGE